MSSTLSPDQVDLREMFKRKFRELANQKEAGGRLTLGISCVSVTWRSIWGKAQSCTGTSAWADNGNFQLSKAQPLPFFWKKVPMVWTCCVSIFNFAMASISLHQLFPIMISALKKIQNTPTAYKSQQYHQYQASCPSLPPSSYGHSNLTFQQGWISGFAQF